MSFPPFFSSILGNPGRVKSKPRSSTEHPFIFRLSRACCRVSLVCVRRDGWRMVKDVILCFIFQWYGCSNINVLHYRTLSSSNTLLSCCHTRLWGISDIMHSPAPYSIRTEKLSPRSTLTDAATVTFHWANKIVSLRTPSRGIGTIFPRIWKMSSKKNRYQGSITWEMMLPEGSFVFFLI